MAKKRKKKEVFISPSDNMTKKDRNNIKNGLRKAFARSAHRKSVIEKVIIPLCLTKNGKKFRTTTRVKCVCCELMYPEPMIEVDHIEEVGAFLGDWEAYIKRIWCAKMNLQVLCKWCHKVKTAEYNQEQQGLIDLL